MLGIPDPSTTGPEISLLHAAGTSIFCVPYQYQGLLARPYIIVYMHLLELATASTSSLLWPQRQ